MTGVVDEPCRPSLCSSFPLVTPPNARSTMKAEKMLAVDLGEDDDDVGKAAVGDPHLLARQREAAIGLARGLGPGPQRVGSRPRLAERVGANQLARHQLRQVPLLLVVGAEHQDWQDAQIGLRAVGRAKRRRAGDVLGDDQRRDLVELDAAVHLGHVDAQQAQLAASAQERAGEVPVLLLEAFDRRHHLGRGELLGRLRDEAMVVGHPLGREGRPRPSSIRSARHPPRVAVAVVITALQSISDNRDSHASQRREAAKAQAQSRIPSAQFDRSSSLAVRN